MKTVAGAGALLEQDNYAFMVKIRRRGMTRWELPSAVMHAGERAEDTAFRCVFEESNHKTFVRVDSTVCFYFHQSRQLDSTFFGMFFQCSLDETNKEFNVPPIIKQSQNLMPQSARQQIIQSGFVLWRDIPEREIHPLHKKLLLTWHENKKKEIFLISGDADAELPFYFGTANEDSLGLSIVIT